MKKAIGFIGSAAIKMKPKAVEMAREMGRLAAENGFVSYSGACLGLPHEAIKGAKEAGGLTIGVAPAESFKDHKEKWGYPHEEFDSILFTGMGRGRNFLLVRACDVVFLCGGRAGTLNEATCAFDEGKLIAVIKEMGGVAAHMGEIEPWFEGKKTGAKIIFGETPKELFEKILSELKD